MVLEYTSSLYPSVNMYLNDILVSCIQIWQNKNKECIWIVFNESHKHLGILGIVFQIDRIWMKCYDHGIWFASNLVEVSESSSIVLTICLIIHALESNFRLHIIESLFSKFHPCCWGFFVKTSSIIDYSRFTNFAESFSANRFKVEFKGIPTVSRSEWMSSSI